MISDIGVVIVAAGSSSRFGKEDKLTLKLNGTPLFTHCIATFSQLIPKENIVVVSSPERVEEISSTIENTLGINVKVIAGGKERSDSSLNGLKALPENLKYAAVHDAARPFISSESIKKCIESLRAHGSAVLAHPVTDTIKVAPNGLKVAETPSRDTLFGAETPQMFIKSDLISAYENSPEDRKITDEAMAMELAGFPVYLTVHEDDNRKITYARDLEK